MQIERSFIRLLKKQRYQGRKYLENYQQSRQTFNILNRN